MTNGENTTYQKLRDAAKLGEALLRGKFIGINDHIKKCERWG